jgi:glucose/mannose-6-phosphate isomerase
MSNLSREKIAAIDRQNMHGLMEQFPMQWKKAVERTETLSLRVDSSRIQNICMSGMGSSVIGADLIRAYSYETCPYPIQVVRHYHIPNWVDENTLFIACSFSGSTEETLSAVSEAAQKGAQILVLTSGGNLMVEASKYNFDYIIVPDSMPSRTALASGFIALFRVFQSLGWIDEAEEALQETTEFLKQQGQMYDNIDESEALSLAELLVDTLPIIYSGTTTLQPVNLRWRTQFEENAKTIAYGNTFPEMTHNEIVGWEQITHLTGRLSVVILKEKDDDAKVQQRMKIMEDLISDQVESANVFTTRGYSRLTRMFSLIQLGDWTSFYLAMLNRVDPTPTPKIDLLKRRLSEL